MKVIVGERIRLTQELAVPKGALIVERNPE